MLVHYIKRGSFFVLLMGILVLFTTLLISNGNTTSVLAGVGPTPTPDGNPPPPPQPTATPAPGHQPTVIEFPLAFSTYSPCANNGLGEIIDLTGTVKFSAFGVEDSNNVVHFRFNDAYLNTTGIGQSTGSIYQVVKQSVTHITVDEDTNTTTITASSHSALIGRGQTENMNLNSNFRVILYADGSVELITNHFWVTCQ